MSPLLHVVGTSEDDPSGRSAVAPFYEQGGTPATYAPDACDVTITLTARGNPEHVRKGIGTLVDELLKSPAVSDCTFAVTERAA